MAKKKNNKSLEVNLLKNTNNCKPRSPFGGYGLGMIGTAVYFISTATGFWNGMWGVIKAFVWPASLIFEVLKYIGA